MRRLLPLFLSLLLFACQAPPAVVDENSPYYPLPAGSRLTLKQGLTVPAESAHVTLQGGRVRDDHHVNAYQPNCRLEVQKRRDTPQKVEPDEFRVRRARHEQQTARVEGALRVARRVVDGGPTFVRYQTILDLESARQPQVRWMICEQWGDPATGRHLTVREIRLALGDTFTLTLP